VLVVTTATWWMIGRWPPARLCLVGLILAILGSLTLGMVVGRDLFTWLVMVPPEHHRYFGQRILFRIATLPDIPLLQVTLAGIVVWIVGRRVSTRVLLSGEGSTMPP